MGSFCAHTPASAHPVHLLVLPATITAGRECSDPEAPQPLVTVLSPGMAAPAVVETVALMPDSPVPGRGAMLVAFYTLSAPVGAGTELCVDVGVVGLPNGCDTLPGFFGLPANDPAAPYPFAIVDGGGGGTCCAPCEASVPDPDPGPVPKPLRPPLVYPPAGHYSPPPPPGERCSPAASHGWQRQRRRQGRRDWGMCAGAGVVCVSVAWYSYSSSA